MNFCSSQVDLEGGEEGSGGTADDGQSWVMLRLFGAQ